MMRKKVRKVFIFLSVLWLVWGSNVYSESVITDGDILVSKDELKWAAKFWSPADREKAVTDMSDRFYLLNRFILNRKIAEEINQLSKSADPEFYWQTVFATRNLQNKMFIKHYKETLKVPDLTKLAKEQYRVLSDKFVAEPEFRTFSQILIKCKKCNIKEKRKQVDNILLALREGADFEKMVEKHSEDLTSKATKGKVDRWVKKGEPHMVGEFNFGIFTIKKIGAYSDVIESRLGFQIVRLDGIKKETYKPEEEVLPEITKKIEKAYKGLALASFLKTFYFTDEAKVDDDAVNEILEAYRVTSTPDSEVTKKIPVIPKVKENLTLPKKEGS